MNETAPDIDALRAAFLDPDARRRTGPDHPAANALWAAAAGELSAAERDALLDHVGACGACAEAWRLILEVDRQRRGTHGTVALPPTRRFFEILFLNDLRLQLQKFSLTLKGDIWLIGKFVIEKFDHPLKGGGCHGASDNYFDGDIEAAPILEE